MVKKIIGLLILAFIMLGVVSTATFANFNDSESSSKNKLAAGTFDLRTNGVNSVTATLININVKPNNAVNGSTIQLSNAGLINGATLNISFSYIESDNASQNGTPNMTADQVAAVLQVTVLSYDTINLLALPLTDTNSNGYIDVQDLINAINTAKMSLLSGLNAGATKLFNISVLLRDGISNDFQGDGINITMTFTLNQ
jgi:predicted ribosomally synthesized peptide with SipW-like signal peptide